MSLDFKIPSAGGAYQLPQSALDFWIRDLNPGAPVVTPATFNINENLSVGSVVGSVAYTDPDSDPVVWSIISGNTGAAFAINSTNGVITVDAGLDYRTLNTYSLLVRATDSSALYGESVIVINLASTAPVVTPASFSIFEALSIGSNVGTLAFTDVDDSTVTWSIRSGNVGSAFSITSGTGIVKVASALDYNTRSSYTLVVRATDPGGRYGEASIAIGLLSSTPTVTPDTFSIAENLAPGAPVGTMVFSDPDDLTTSWSITSGNTGTAFAINSLTGDLTVANTLDYRTKNTYTLVVRATDPSGRYAEANAIINLSSTAPVVSGATFGIDEDLAVGGAVGALTYTDVDDGTVTWSIRSGNVGSAFSVNSSTGVIAVANALDYREKNSYTLVLRATDPGGRYGEANAAINLTSTAPVVTAATFSVGELEPIGTVVGTVSAADPQGDTDLHFAITSGSSDGAFAIDSVTGEITTAGETDYETKPVYVLTVLVTDSTGRWGAGAITINLIDQIEVYLPPAPEFLVGLTTPWAERGVRLDAGVSLGFESSKPLDVESSAKWSRLRALDSKRALSWQDLNSCDSNQSLLWSRLMSAPDRITGLPWATSNASDVSCDLPWTPRMEARDAAIELDWRTLIVRDDGVVVVFADVDPHPTTGNWFDAPQIVQSGANIDALWPGPSFNFHTRSAGDYSLPQTTLNFSMSDIGAYEMLPPVNLLWAPVRTPAVQPHVVDGVEFLPWAVGHPVDKSQGFESGALTGLPGAGVGLPWNNDPLDFEQIDVPPLKVYNTMNAISVVRLPERTSLNPIGLRLQYDDSTFCWTGTLVFFNEAEVNLLKPSLITKREIEVTVNGFVVVLSIQGRARERKFPSQRWTLQAKGRQAYLAELYSRPRSLISETMKSAAQLALDELPSGWTLDWQVPDWNIPAGMWSYNGLTPIKAIARLAGAVGAIIQPDPEDQKIVVRSRYPISPMTWHAVTPDISLPDAVCTTIGDADKPGELRNRVFIEATRAPGIRVGFTRVGTGGDDPLPSITEELCTAVACGTERGRVELDSTGPSIDQVIALPILSSPGVILPGLLIEVTEGVNAWRGLTRGISIEAQRIDRGWAVSQTLSIERREAA